MVTGHPYRNISGIFPRASESHEIFLEYFLMSQYPLQISSEEKQDERH